MSYRKTTCGCGKPARPFAFLCESCFALLAAESTVEDNGCPGRQFLPDSFYAQHTLATKLNQLSDREWHRFTLIGMPTRLR
jgi:hypothetical protein